MAKRYVYIHVSVSAEEEVCAFVNHFHYSATSLPQTELWKT